MSALRGVIGLLLSLFLIAGGLPAHADVEPPPAIPHEFTGTVSVDGGPADEGTTVQAFVDDVEDYSTAVDGQSRYTLLVPGPGTTVTFRVGGVLANETAVWESGKRDEDFHLTVGEPPPVSFPFPIPCFIATAAYGTPTAPEIDVLREFRDVVLLESAAGSQFVALYYRLGPPAAEAMARSDLLRTLVRELMVDPLVRMTRATGHLWRD